VNLLMLSMNARQALLTHCASSIIHRAPNHIHRFFPHANCGQAPVQELHTLASAMSGMSARDLKAVCEVAERRWVAAVIRGKEAKGSVPPLRVYLLSADARRASLQGTLAVGSSQEQQKLAMAKVQQLYTPVAMTRHSG
jgi:hypothetical protein